MSAGSDQIRRIDDYVKQRRIPVYYNFYNPPSVPLTSVYPASAGSPFRGKNLLGCRVLSSIDVHKATASVVAGKPPTFDEMAIPGRTTKTDSYSSHGWRLETFIADEVLRCREGRLFTDSSDQDLAILLGGRTAPIQSAISITVDLGPDKRTGTGSRGPKRRIRL